MKRILLFATLFLLGYAGFSAPPTTASSNFSVTESAKEGTYFTMSFTAGNGTGRIVIAKKGSAVTAVPVNGIGYTANTNFGQGFEIAPGEFVVYAGAGSSITMRNLEPSTEYHLAIFDYNGSGGTTEYLVSPYLAASASSAAPPTVQASNLNFTNVSGNKLRLNWTNGSGRGRLVIAKAGSPVDVSPTNLVSYSAYSSFGSGTQLGSGNFVVYKSNTSFADITNLRTGTIMHFAVFEYNGNSEPIFLTATTAAASQATTDRPTQAATGLYSSSPDGNALRLTWTPGNGSGRILVARKGSPVSTIPADGTDYTANYIFGNGAALAPGEFVLYKGNSSWVDISGLEASSTYHFAVFEYDLRPDGKPAYLTSSFPVTTGTTLSAPTVPTTNIIFSEIGSTSMKLSWTAGNGNKRIVIASEGSPVTALPENFKNYYTSSTFGNGAVISPGNYAIAGGAVHGVTVTGLKPGVTYHYAIFEANGGSGPVYQLTDPARGSAATSSRPNLPSYNLSYSGIEGNSMRVSFSMGNGSGRIIVARAGAPVTSVPADGVDYPASTVFGSGTEMNAGEFVMLNSNTSWVDISGLQPATTYYFAVFEYAGTGASRQYLTSSFLAGNKATLSPPTISASNMTFSSVTNNSMNVNWTNGNGSRRLMVAKAGAPVDADPENLKSYFGSGSFGSGTHLGNGNYVMYNGNGSSAALTAMQPGVTYYFRMYEANGNSGPVYKYTDPLTGSQTTLGRPSVAASNLSFSSIEGNSVRLSWTSGNGTRRIVVAREGATVSGVPQDGTDYTASAQFGMGQQLGAGEYVVYNGNSSFVDISGLAPDKAYHFAIYEYAGTGASIAYLVSSFGIGQFNTLSAPTIQASNLMFSAVGSNSATISWNNGNGNRRLVVVREGQPTAFTPADLTKYAPNTNFGLSIISPGHSAVYSNTGNSVTVTGLSEGLTYHVAVFEYNGTEGPVYLGATPLVGSFTTFGAPTIQSSDIQWGYVSETSITLGWQNGNGQRRILLAREVTAVDGVPADNQVYLANPFFGSGDQVGAGNFVVYNGTGNTVTISNINPAVDYYFALFEYNQFGPSSLRYLIGGPATFILPANSTLPVTWLDFTGKNINGQVKLEWKTTAESENRLFEVERSIDGKNFSRIGSVLPGTAGDHINFYSYTDNNPVAEGYYRIRQIDINGRFEFSKVITVRSSEREEVKILQNPVRAILRFYSSANFAGGKAEVISVSGATIASAVITGSTTAIGLGNARPGVYYLRVVSRSGEVVTVGFVVRGV